MTFEKVKEIIVTELGLEESEIKEDTSFEAMGLDSLDIVENDRFMCREGNTSWRVL